MQKLTRALNKRELEAGLKKEFARRAVHLDFHTMPGVRDFGSDFNAEDFADTLSRAKVDYITVFAKCNLGFAYYPTETGVAYPGMDFDMLGRMVEACHGRGIKVAAYFNAGLDHEHAGRHREWCKVNKDGQVYEMHRVGSSFFRRMCFNTGYGKLLLGMVEEVLQKYPVDGIFLDCIQLTPCFGTECLEGMQKAGMQNILSEETANRYCWEMTLDYSNRVKRLVASNRPGINVFFNGLPYRINPTHLELEILPTGSWGYDYLPHNIRHARTLGKPFFTMTGRFHKSWSDFGGLRPFHSLMFDCYNSIANGGSCSVGDHMHPRGKLEPEVYRLIEKVYSKIEELEPWVEDASPRAEMVIINPEFKDFPAPWSVSNEISVRGASRMMMELKYQFDVSDGEGDISKYKVMVLPDNVQPDKTLRDKIQDRLNDGAALISSSFAGLNPEKSSFAFEGCGMEYLGESPHHPEYFLAKEDAAAGLPDMPVAVYESGILMKPLKDARVLADHIKPYSNKGDWDGFHCYVYNPPDVKTGNPAVVKSGNIIHFSFPIFKGYFDNAVVPYKRLFSNCVGMLYDKPAIKVENMPSFGQVTLMEKDGRKIVHLLAYLPELRGRQMNIIEEPIEVPGIVLSYRNDGEKIGKAYIAPDMTPLQTGEEGEYTIVKLPPLKGYAMVVLETS